MHTSQAPVLAQQQVNQPFTRSPATLPKTWAGSEGPRIEQNLRLPTNRTCAWTLQRHSVTVWAATQALQSMQRLPYLGDLSGIPHSGRPLWSAPVHLAATWTGPGQVLAGSGSRNGWTNPLNFLRGNRPLTRIRRSPFYCWNWGMPRRGESAKSTGQVGRPALRYYDDGATCTVIMSMSLYLWCWTEEA